MTPFALLLGEVGRGPQGPSSLLQWWEGQWLEEVGVAVAPESGRRSM